VSFGVSRVVEPIDVELTVPLSVAGRATRRQSAWFLVRLVHARLNDPRDPLVRRDDLLGRVTEAVNIRMMVSRAFRELEDAGVVVGWGEDAERDPRFLPRERRGRGPFWIPASEAARVRCLVGGRPATTTEIGEFLGTRTTTDGIESAVARPDPPTVWFRYLAAGRAMREGRPLDGALDGRAGALSHLRAAARDTASEARSAFAALSEAMVWRRLGDYDQARTLLRRLRSRRRSSRVFGDAYLEAMSTLIEAWCAHDQRDTTRAQALLDQMIEGEERAALVRYHPLVRCERHNLAGLLARSRSLAAEDPARAATEGRAALAHLDAAFAAALESTTDDSIQRVASNLGVTVWLTRSPSDDPRTTRASAIQWIALSEWLIRGAGGGGLHNAWNAVALMRIARGAWDGVRRPSAAEFRSRRPPSPAEIARDAGPYGEALTPDLWPARWAEVAALRLARHDAGEHRYSRPQICGLLFERAWFALADGAEDEAAEAVSRLRRRAVELVESDRDFFLRDLLPLLPEEFAEVD